jgi:hypothetical protein
MIDPMNRSPIPKVPFWLGAGVLVPYVALAGAVWASPEPYTPALLFWLSSYASVILSFLGAVHWGIALIQTEMNEHDRGVFMTWSIVPALAAWVSLLMPIKTGLLLLIATYVVQFAADRQLASRFRIPDWYIRLRAGITSVSVLCLAIALFHLARR